MYGCFECGAEKLVGLTALRHQFLVTARRRQTPYAILGTPDVILDLEFTII